MKNLFKKKIFFLFVIQLIFLFQIFAENTQIVLPKNICTGERVEIRYIFKSAEDLFFTENDKNTQFVIHLKENSDFLSRYEEDFSVTGGFLQKNGGEYILTLTIVPWKTGFLEFPRFNIKTFVQNCEPVASKMETTGFTIALSPIEVNSLVTKTGIRDFLPEKAPLVLPGTTGLLVLLGIITFILLSALIYAFLHIQRLSSFISNLLYLYSLKKNSRKTLKKILSLQKDSDKISDDKDFSEVLQHILRDFLNVRFGHDFSSATTSSLYGIFSDLCGTDFSSHQSETIDNLISIFMRLDFIRFSENASFMQEERRKIINSSLTLIEDFDREESDASL